MKKSSRMMASNVALAALVAMWLSACGAEDTTPSSTADVASATDGGVTADAQADATANGDSGSDASSEPKLYGVGVRNIEVIGANGRKLPTEVWYPIAADTTGEAATYLNGVLKSPNNAVRGAKPAAGPWPLVVFSHGNGGVRDQSPFLTEWLARNGYVVASPDHVGNTTLHMKDEWWPSMALWRPQDIQAVIAAMTDKETTEWWAGLVDGDKIGVTGHSFGGYTSLAVAGLDVLKPFLTPADCDDSALPEESKLLCTEVKKLGDAPYNFADPRVRVAVPLAHAGYGSVGKWKLLATLEKGAEHIPLVMIGATGDNITRIILETRPLYKALASPAAMISIKGGSHYSFADICALKGLLPASFKAAIGDICEPDAKPTIEESYDIINTYTLAAMDLYLKGDESARETFKASDGELFQVESQGIVGQGK